jgi:hypothetical protein
MALDHYISQVYLRRFFAPDLGERLYALRKSDLKAFTPGTNVICGINEGNTNEYLTDPRAIEEFLKTVEGRFNAAVVQLEKGTPHAADIYTIAGLAGYFLTCSPAGMRLSKELMEFQLEAEAKAADDANEFAPPPESLGGKSLTELLEAGKLKFKVDPKYPQAVGVSNIFKKVVTLGNMSWELLHNPHEDCRFVCSDYPFAHELLPASSTVVRTLPLSPKLALRIVPVEHLRWAQLGYDFRHFQLSQRTLSRADAVTLNKRLIQCAEELVLSSHNDGWVEAVTKKHSNCRVVTRKTKIIFRGRMVDGFQAEIGTFTR